MFIVKTPEEALGLIRSAFPPCLPAEHRPLDLCRGRILAQGITASEYVPDFDRSTVDGFALRARDTFACSDTIPALLPLAGEIEMGMCPEEPLPDGACMRIPTGGALPQGADAVVMMEWTEEYGDGTIGILKPVSPGMNRTARGEDLFPGKEVLPAGRKLTVPDLGALAALGITRVPVVKKPLAGILSTGDELVPADQQPGDGQVRDINSTLLTALCLEAGAEVKHYGILKDDPALLAGAVDRALAECDLLLISGGSSVGMKDATADILAARGDILFHGLAVKPGKPTILASLGGKPVFGLPGHPAAAFLMAQVFVRAAIAAITGSTPLPRPVSARLTEAVSANHGRAELLGVHLISSEEGLLAEPIRGKSGLISSLAGADGFLRIPRDCEGLPRGAEADVFCFDPE